MAGQSIDEAFAAILKDCQNIAVEAVKNAAKKTQKDIIVEANSYLQKYYNNYKPKYYKRKFNLHKAITPVFEDKSSGDKISIEVGVEYNSSALNGLYKSNSRWHQSGDAWKPVINYSNFSADNGIPEPDWILENFLEGVHPWAQDDSESTNTLMRDFFNTKLPDRIEQYIQSELFNAITSRL